MTKPGHCATIQSERGKEYRTMYEYEIYNERINEHGFIWGYSVDDAFRRHPSLDRNEWKVIFSEYID